MGKAVILVIGDNFRDQLDRFSMSEHTDSVVVDVLIKLKTRYATLFGSYEEDFCGWVRKYLGYQVLEEGQEPDIGAVHADGWMRIDANGQVFELMERIIPGGLIESFNDTIPKLKLKPGAEGIETSGCNTTEIVEGYAGSVRKDAIDFEAVSNAIRTAANDRWCRAAAACDSQVWAPFELIKKKYALDYHGDELQLNALSAWANQPSVKAILAETDINDVQTKNISALEQGILNLFRLNNSPDAIDPLRLSRNQYMDRFGFFSLVPYWLAIHDGLVLNHFDDAYFSCLTDDTILTLASVRV
ncbi:hypothetical protein ACO0LM_25180 [Undibacterium sp. Di26W]|uniref:hypothetical protein n=1 Tax=Undibacterium sp. Di26W TaxID=3413035 RepID=UPI003BF11E55